LLEKARQVDITINTLRTMYISSIVNTNSDVVGSISESANVIPNGYNKNATLKNKVAFIIKRENRFIHVREISKLIHDIDPFAPVDDIVKKLSPIMSSLQTKDIIVKIKTGSANINTFWGSKNWLDENGNPIPGHEYNKEYITGSDDSTLEI
jgi:hypothetical protein